MNNTNEEHIEKEIILNEQKNESVVGFQLDIKSYDQSELQNILSKKIKKKFEKNIILKSIILWIFEMFPESTPEDVVLNIQKNRKVKDEIITRINKSKYFENVLSKITDIVLERIEGEALQISVDIKGPIFNDLINCLFEKLKNNKYKDMIRIVACAANDVIEEDVKLEIVERIIIELQEEICSVISEFVMKKIGIKMEIGGIRLLKNK